MKLSALLAFFVTYISLAHASLAIDDPSSFTNLTDCSSVVPIMNLKATSLQPFPLCVGAKACLTLTGPLKEPIVTGGAWSHVERLFNRIDYTDNQPLDVVLAAGGNPVPIPASAPGTNSTIRVCTTTPPGGIYKLPQLYTYVLTSADGRTIACVSGTVSKQICA
ncbi:hypothetical protein BGZ83_005981 [Gryganskiella cystojenkinii]|nr:hypothetical protein BGZ83_005981 [Gryganskiella cystojenkinii]